MKKLIFLFAALLIVFLGYGSSLANGVGIINAGTGVYLKLTSSQVNVSVQNQVAVITTTQSYFNQLPTDTSITFAFPMSDGASATGLRWYVNGIWYQAVISPTPQDTNLPGGSIECELKNLPGCYSFDFSYPGTGKERLYN